MRFSLSGEGKTNDYLAIALFAYDADKPATEISEDTFNELFGQLPPRTIRSANAVFGYLVPEPVTHNDDGQVYVMICQYGGRFYVKYVTYGKSETYINEVSIRDAYPLGTADAA